MYKPSSAENVKYFFCLKENKISIRPIIFATFDINLQIYIKYKKNVAKKEVGRDARNISVCFFLIWSMAIEQ